MSKRAPHLRTPDYPRSDLARYLAAVMQLFDPKCEGVYVSHVERTCSELWDKLSPEYQEVARVRVEVLYTLFSTPDVKRTSIFEVLHDEFVLDKFLTWYDSAKDLLKSEGPKSFARAAYKAGQQDADERLEERHSRAQLQLMKLQGEQDTSWRNAALRDDLFSAQETMGSVIKQLKAGVDVEKIVSQLEEELEQPRYRDPKGT